MTWPTKTDFVDGDVLTAAQVNNIGTNLNEFDPTGITAGYAPKSDGAGGITWGAAGAYSLLSTTSLAGASSVTVSSIPQTYRHLFFTIWDCYVPNAAKYMWFYPNAPGIDGAYANTNGFYTAGSTTTLSTFADYSGATGMLPAQADIRSVSNQSGATLRTNFAGIIYNYASSDQRRTFQVWRSGYGTVAGQVPAFVNGYFNNLATAAITSFYVSCTDTFTAGTLKLYGVS